MNGIDSFFTEAEYQNNPLAKLVTFLAAQPKLEAAGNYEAMRFVGYVLDISFEEVKIITCDPYKKAVGGVPRGSFLIMAPDSLDGLPPHFTLLRVTGTAPTPLSQDVQQTYFELHKKSMPELDVWTAGELQWGALSTQVLGMFYPDQSNSEKMAFSGDVNNVVSGHRYKVYAPDDELLNLIVNGTVPQDNNFELGKLRLTECQLPFLNKPQPNVAINISTNDFRGFRTAMFGKTRMGKSNVVKLIAQSLIETTLHDNSIGQLIFDINGEYANDNPQDGNRSLRSAYAARCHVYALTARKATPSKPLKLNFYEQPKQCMEVLASLLELDGKSSIYMKSFAGVNVPSIEEAIAESNYGDKTRAIRKIQFYWAILIKAGFDIDTEKLHSLGLYSKNTHNFNPGFNKALRQAIYDHAEMEMPAKVNSIHQLVKELELLSVFKREKKNDKTLNKDGEPVFDPDDGFMLDFLEPLSGAGPAVLKPYAAYHSSNAGDFIGEIIQLLDAGKTVILDLGNANENIRAYFADMLSKAVFRNQENKFTSNTLRNHFVQLYFEEAHNLFPKDSKTVTDVYSRFAKEGAKFHIGMVYSTQSPSTISKDLLAQTENFFVAHLASQDEANALAKMQNSFNGLQQDILSARTPGYMRMLTFSHRFVIPVQATKFEVEASL